MADRPMIFSGSMVKALLDGRKSVTRRVLKPQPDTSRISAPFHPEPREGRTWVFMARDDFPGYSYATADFRAPCAPGDRLWCREGWAYCSPSVAPGRAIYRADHPDLPSPGLLASKWRPSIHMPRWASRITLTVTEVRVERVGEISEEDARAEGIELEVFDQAPAARDYSRGDGWFIAWPDCGDASTDIDELFRRSFRSLWDSLNGAKPGCSWADNPFVAAIRFDVDKRNIDQKEPSHDD